MYVAQPIGWTDRGVVMLDQRLLPGEEVSYTYTNYREVAKAIRDMVIRGAPAIGVAAAMGAALGVLHSSATSVEALRVEFTEICDAASQISENSTRKASTEVADEWRTPSAAPIAAATPIAGAPRMTISRMALATSR